MSDPSVESWQDPKRVLCYCHNVSAGTVRDVIRTSGATSVDEVSRLCRAGTGCKSCLPDIETILAQEIGARPSWWRRLWARLGKS